MALKNISDGHMLPLSVLNDSAPTTIPALESDPPKPAPSSPPPSHHRPGDAEDTPPPQPSKSSPPSKDVDPPVTSPPPTSPPPPSPSPPPPSSSSLPPSPPPLSSAPPPVENGNHNIFAFSDSSPSPPPPHPRRGSPPSSSTSRVIAPSSNGLTPSPPPPGIGTASSGNTSHQSSSDPVKYVGYTLAAVFIVALVAVAIFVFRKKKSKGDTYAPPYMPPPHLKFHMKPGVDGLYYGAHPGPQSPFGSGRNLGRSMSQLGPTLDQAVNGQIAFSYDMVTEMTDSFSSQNIIGEGGFGCVYKGFLPEGKAVAVKQLKAGSMQGEREFRAEVEIISRVHHRHLVSLVGYCISDQHRMLIYEYVPNGTLHHHLHGNGMPVLDWDKRLKIAIGAAKGLAYLHEDCSQKIIHRDIKSSNILVDDAFEAQVADFGLARLTDTANTHVSTRVMGTFGYMALEYAISGKLTDRSDVFSFGVVLLELLTGRKPVDETQPLGEESLVEWARPLLLRAIETHECRDVIDPRLENNFVESEMFKMIEAAAACVRHSAPKRPRMVQVVRALDCGDEISDLSNGVKYGQSTVYDSGQYDKEIMLFRRMISDSNIESESDMYNRGYGLESGSQHALMPNSSSGQSESKTFDKHRSSNN